MITQKCKGARDLLPNDMKAFRRIEEVFRRCCISWGYGEVRSPTLEYLHLFTAAGTLTPGMLSRVYSFLDWDGWSGERVVLRPDGTIPVARLYIENLIKRKIARLFYVTNVFAFEETGKENRERWQCGGELIGNRKVASDVELILLSLEILRGLDIGDIEIRLSHAGMLRGLLKELRLNSDEEAKLLDMFLDGNWQALSEIKSKDSHGRKLLSLFMHLRGKTSGSLKELKALTPIAPDLRAALDNFSEIAALLDALGCRYVIDITSTRGFEYYTGLCFQFFVQEQKIGSGGRYDDLIPLIGGEATPACGFALYIDPIIDLIQPRRQMETKPRVLVRSSKATTQSLKTSFKLANSIRRAGYEAELDFNGQRRDYPWIVTVLERPSAFLVLDRTRKQKKEVNSIRDVVSILGGST